MKAYNLKITVAILAFVLGIVCVWSIGGFTYLTHLSEQSPSIVQTVPEVSIAPLTSISLETEKTFIKRELNFEDYPASKIYKGKTAEFKLPNAEYIDSDWFQYVFENSEVDFAGHYILSNKSCGMWCSIVDIIDAKTGKFYGVNVFPEVCLSHLDNEFDCSESFSNIDYRIDSNLLVLFGFRYINNNYDDGEKGFHYYKFENGEITHLKSILVKDQRSARQVQLDKFDETNK